MVQRIVEQTVSRVQEQFPDAVQEVVNFRDETTLILDPARLVEVMTFLRDAPDLRYSMCADVTAVDWDLREPRFDVVYHLLSLDNASPIRVKIGVPEDNMVAPSVTGVWAGANWYEREVYDLFGITFEGHPDLRRIMMPDHWQGHPLQKTYPIMGPEPYDQRFGNDEPWKRRP